MHWQDRLFLMFRKFRIFNGLGKLGNSGFTVDIHRPPLPLYWLPPQPSLFAIPEKRVQCVSVTMDQASIVLSVAFPCIVFRRQRRNRVKKCPPALFQLRGQRAADSIPIRTVSAMFALRFRNSSTSVSTREKQYSGFIVLCSVIFFFGRNDASRISFEISSVYIMPEICPP